MEWNAECTMLCLCNVSIQSIDLWWTMRAPHWSVRLEHQNCQYHTIFIKQFFLCMHNFNKIAPETNKKSYDRTAREREREEMTLGIYHIKIDQHFYIFTFLRKMEFSSKFMLGILANKNINHLFVFCIHSVENSISGHGLMGIDEIILNFQ